MTGSARPSPFFVALNQYLQMQVERTVYEGAIRGSSAPGVDKILALIRESSLEDLSMVFENLPTTHRSYNPDGNDKITHPTLLHAFARYNLEVFNCIISELSSHLKQSEQKSASASAITKNQFFAALNLKDSEKKTLFWYLCDGGLKGDGFRKLCDILSSMQLDELLIKQEEGDKRSILFYLASENMLMPLCRKLSPQTLENGVTQISRDFYRIFSLDFRLDVPVLDVVAYSCNFETIQFLVNTVSPVALATLDLSRTIKALDDNNILGREEQEMRIKPSRLELLKAHLTQIDNFINHTETAVIANTEEFMKFVHIRYGAEINVSHSKKWNEIFGKALKALTSQRRRSSEMVTAVEELIALQKGGALAEQKKLDVESSHSTAKVVLGVSAAAGASAPVVPSAPPYSEVQAEGQQNMSVLPAEAPPSYEELQKQEGVMPASAPQNLAPESVKVASDPAVVADKITRLKELIEEKGDPTLVRMLTQLHAGLVKEASNLKDPSLVKQLETIQEKIFKIADQKAPHAVLFKAAPSAVTPSASEAEAKHEAKAKKPPPKKPLLG